MCEVGRWPLESITVHSANPVASEYMGAMIERERPFQRVLGTQRFERI